VPVLPSPPRLENVISFGGGNLRGIINFDCTCMGSSPRKFLSIRKLRDAAYVFIVTMETKWRCLLNKHDLIQVWGTLNNKEERRQSKGVG
jgi:hypothetical protein